MVEGAVGWGPLALYHPGMLLRDRVWRAWRCSFPITGGEQGMAGTKRAGTGGRPRRLARRVMLCFMAVSGGWMLGRVLL